MSKYNIFDNNKQAEIKNSKVALVDSQLYCLCRMKLNCAIQCQKLKKTKLSNFQTSLQHLADNALSLPRVFLSSNFIARILLISSTVQFICQTQSKYENDRPY